MKTVCTNCHIELTRRDQRKFCSRTCAASYNNRKYPKRKKKYKECKECGSKIDSHLVYCGKACREKKYKTPKKCPNPRDRTTILVKECDSDKLENLVNSQVSISEMATEMNMSPTTIRSCLWHFGLKTKPKFSHEDASEGTQYCPSCDRVKPVESFYKDKTPRKRMYTGWCRECNSLAAKSRQQENKRYLVKLKGGSCSRCGYSKYMGALEFHHISPESKDPSWAGMKNWKLERVIKEVEKCLLLCSNCHREVHAELRLD